MNLLLLASSVQSKIYMIFGNFYQINSIMCRRCQRNVSYVSRFVSSNYNFLGPESTEYYPPEEKKLCSMGLKSQIFGLTKQY